MPRGAIAAGSSQREDVENLLTNLLDIVKSGVEVSWEELEMLQRLLDVLSNKNLNKNNNSKGVENRETKSSNKSNAKRGVQVQKTARESDENKENVVEMITSNNINNIITTGNMFISNDVVGKKAGPALCINDNGEKRKSVDASIITAPRKRTRTLRFSSPTSNNATAIVAVQKQVKERGKQKSLFELKDASKLADRLKHMRNKAASPFSPTATRILQLGYDGLRNMYFQIRGVRNEMMMFKGLIFTRIARMIEDNTITAKQVAQDIPEFANKKGKFDYLNTWRARHYAAIVEKLPLLLYYESTTAVVESRTWLEANIYSDPVLRDMFK